MSRLPAHAAPLLAWRRAESTLRDRAIQFIVAKAESHSGVQFRERDSSLTGRHSTPVFVGVGMAAFCISATYPKRIRMTKRSATDAPGPTRFLRRRNAAAYLGISEATLRAWVTRGRGPKVTRLGRMCVYDISDLEAWVTEQQQRGSSAHVA